MSMMHHLVRGSPPSLASASRRGGVRLISFTLTPMTKSFSTSSSFAPAVDTRNTTTAPVGATASSSSTSGGFLQESSGTIGNLPEPRSYRRVPTALPRMDPPEELYRERNRLPGDLAIFEGGLRRQQPWEKDARWQHHKTMHQGADAPLKDKALRRGWMQNITVKHKNGKVTKRPPFWSLIKDPTKDPGQVVVVLLMFGITIHGCCSLPYGEHYWVRRRKALRERIRIEYDLPVGWEEEFDLQSDITDDDLFVRGWEEDKTFRVLPAFIGDPIMQFRKWLIRFVFFGEEGRDPNKGPKQVVLREGEYDPGR
ncbi:unnamed protein product [Amoebophrya sp. A25]|nr:unnamed protein product [Amoebophrya sp. A25]|eukprot:GSA25T00027320001.1